MAVDTRAILWDHPIMKPEIRYASDGSPVVIHHHFWWYLYPFHNTSLTQVFVKWTLIWLAIVAVVIGHFAYIHGWMRPMDSAASYQAFYGVDYSQYGGQLDQPNLITAHPHVLAYLIGLGLGFPIWLYNLIVCSVEVLDANTARKLRLTFWIGLQFLLAGREHGRREAQRQQQQNTQLARAIAHELHGSE